jgi:hypothetical protein
VSIAHYRAALAIGGLSATEKAVLLCHAWHANHLSGTSWTKADTVAAEICAAVRTVQVALADLRSRGLLHVQAYEHGGRGRSTEYQVCVFPGGRFLIPAESTKGADSAPFSTPAKGAAGSVKGADAARNPRTEYVAPESATSSGPSASDGVGAISGAPPIYKNLRTTHSARAPAPARERPADAAAPQPPIPTRLTPAQSVAEALRRAVPGLHVSAALDQLPMHPQAATPADREEAQDRDPP